MCLCYPTTQHIYSVTYTHTHHPTHIQCTIYTHTIQHTYSAPHTYTTPTYIQCITYTTQHIYSAPYTHTTQHMYSVSHTYTPPLQHIYSVPHTYTHSPSEESLHVLLYKPKQKSPHEQNFQSRVQHTLLDYCVHQAFRLQRCGKHRVPTLGCSLTC